MNVIRIVNRDSGNKILVEIVNSVAQKYDCQPSDCKETGKTSTNCDSAQNSQLIEETAGIFGMTQDQEIDSEKKAKPD